MDAELRAPQAQPITILGQQTSARVTSCDPTTGLLVLTSSEQIHPDYPLDIDGHHYPITATVDNHVWVRNLDQDHTGHEATQLVPDTTTAASLARLSTFWATYWCSTPQLDQDGWNDLLAHLPPLPDAPELAFPPIDAQSLRAHYRQLISTPPLASMAYHGRTS